MFKDTHDYRKRCPRCQQLGHITTRDMMSLNPIIIVKIFYVWSTDFMGAFLTSFENVCILLTVDYMSKLVEAISSRTNEARVVVKFLT